MSKQSRRAKALRDKTVQECIQSLGIDKESLDEVIFVVHQEKKSTKKVFDEFVDPT